MRGGYELAFRKPKIVVEVFQQMPDTYDQAKRSEVKSRVKSKNTKPEVRVRSALHGLGYRFRLHRKELPGKPDIVLPKHRTIIFVHGCFWHQHYGCKRAKVPRRNAGYWGPKLRRNAERDEEARRRLQEQGWRVLILWECEIPRRRDELRQVLTRALREAG
jgi:DNA mismatch endonuclease, patch repair protein